MVKEMQIANNTAYIIKRINEISGTSPGKKTLQKMVFLIEQTGVGLDYDFGIHFYGPYSALLDGETKSLSADGVINFDYSSGYSHRMKIAEGVDVIAEDIPAEQVQEIDKVIERFCDKAPSYLELLTTAIYAYDNLKNKSKESVVNGVVKIKGTKYSREQILRSFADFGYFGKTFEA